MPCVDPGWIDTDPGGGRSTLTLKSEVGITLPDPGWIDTGGGQSTLTLVKLGLPCADPGWINTDPGGCQSTLTLKSEVQIVSANALWVYYNALWVIFLPVTHSCMWPFFVILLYNHGYMSKIQQMSGQCTFFI